MFWLCVIQIAADEKNISVTSVIMNAGSLKRAMKKPLSSPISTPTSSMTHDRDDGRHRMAGKNAALLGQQRAPERAAAEQQLVGGAGHDDRAGDAGKPHRRAERQVDARR